MKSINTKIEKKIKYSNSVGQGADKTPFEAQVVAKMMPPKKPCPQKGNKGTSVNKPFFNEIEGFKRLIKNFEDGADFFEKEATECTQRVAEFRQSIAFLQRFCNILNEID